ncbi:hypothetical protein [Comamonas sp. lk]|uniref:hypothetical protein n=1 Tax=Comamonas sp. lk TaxID=2201272 RepID=UPI001F0941D6|nr:hypothetical protein [Comamonas sp. lk]
MSRGIIRAQEPPPSMACITQSPAARLLRTSLATVQAARACVLRTQQALRHGVPTAFVSLSGVTAMLSAAVRKV